jgi:hypothetical protein
MLGCAGVLLQPYWQSILTSWGMLKQVGKYVDKAKAKAKDMKDRGNAVYKRMKDDDGPEEAKESGEIRENWNDIKRSAGAVVGKVNARVRRKFPQEKPERENESVGTDTRRQGATRTAVTRQVKKESASEDS